MTKPLFLFAAHMMAFAAILFAQNVVTVSGTAQTSLTQRSAMVAFVTSNAGSAQEALKNATIGEAEGRALGAVAVRAIPIPVVGPLAVEGAMRVFGKFHKPTVKGFSVAYLPGLSAETAIPRGGVTFSVSFQAIQTAGAGAAVSLLRLRTKANDSARIIRSTHIVMRQTSSNVTPVITQVLGTEQDAVACRRELTAGGDVMLSPSSTLEAGEYAVALTSAEASGNALRLWDFRIVQ